MESSYRPADLVATLRKRKGMTQAQFASLLGVTQSLISQWESGSANPSEDAWMRMATVAEHPEADTYYAMAGIQGRNAILIQKSVLAILGLIKRFDSERGSALEGEIAGLNPDARFDRVIQAVTALVPPDPRTASGATLSAEDRKLIEKAREAMDRFWSQEGKPK